MGAALTASAAWGLYTHLHKSGEALSDSGFDLSSVTPSQAPALLPAEREAAQASPAPVVGELADAPPVGLQGRPAASASGAGAPPAAGPARPTKAESERGHEAAFLAAHRAEIKRYHGRLTDIALKYRRSHKAVREVDEAFARMPRYMEVKRAFDRSGDPFAFARGALALPEVREEISKRLAQPEVWSAALAMINETVKKAPPPKALYTEVLGFLTREGVAEHVEKFTEQAAGQAPLIARSLPPDADMAGLQKMVSDATAAQPRR